MFLSPKTFNLVCTEHLSISSVHWWTCLPAFCPSFQECSSPLKRHTGHSRGGGGMLSLFIDWHSWWGPILHFGRRVGEHAEVAPTRVQGGDGVVVLHRYSTRGFTLSCPVKVCVCPSEGAETGSWMTPASVPDVTAQLGRLMTEGAGPGTHLPVLGRAGDLTGRERSRCHVRWADVLERRQQRQLHYRDPSASLLSPVIEKHVKGQLCDTGCPPLQVVPFSQNTTLTGEQRLLELALI